jgi:hypothetical protein
LLNKLCEKFGVDQSQIQQTSERIFNAYKKYQNSVAKQDQKILSLTMKFLLKDDKPLYFLKSEQPDPTIYVSYLPQFAAEMKEQGKGIVFIGQSFVMGLLGQPQSANLNMD